MARRPPLRYKQISREDMEIQHITPTDWTECANCKYEIIDESMFKIKFLYAAHLPNTYHILEYHPGIKMEYYCKKCCKTERKLYKLLGKKYFSKEVGILDKYYVISR
jgi:hypothetical protein